MKKSALCVLIPLFVLSLAACGNPTPLKSGGPDTPFLTLTDGDNGVSNDNSASARDSGAEAVTEEALSDTDFLLFQAFLNRGDVYGFLLSNYDDPLDADFEQVFYEGAGVNRVPSAEERAAFLESIGLSEDDAFGDIIFIPEADADTVLRRVTGHKLAELRQRGRDLNGLYALPELGGYFHMAGDTNRIRPELLSGVRRSDGTVILESQVRPWSDNDDDTVYGAFRTVVRETDDGPQILSNQITGGMLADYMLWSDYEPEFITAETPPPEYACFAADPAQDHTLPVTLELLSETENQISDVSAWTAEHWNTWMSDPAFAENQNAPVPNELQERFPSGKPEAGETAGLPTKPLDRDALLKSLDRDAFYLYDCPDGVNLKIWNAYSGDCQYAVNLESYLADADYRSTDSVLWREIRWARIVNGILFVSNFHRTSADSSGYHNAYVTALSLYDGSVIWHSAPLVCGTENFDVLGVWENGLLREGVIVCGYGFTGENHALYQLSLETGKTLSRTPLASKPDAIVHANGILYVHCYDRDYQFTVFYG